MADRILIIEDEEKIARFIELELIHEGYEVEKCGDGRTGLELAEGGDFSLVLLDIMLPGLNGLEVLRRLRRTSDVPVIMLTARDAVMDKVAGLDQGADDYITKPFAIEELLARIRLVLRRRSYHVHEAPADAPADMLRCGEYDYMGETNVVDVYIRYLRSKIDEVYSISLIQTVRGVGYVIRDENEQ